MLYSYAFSIISLTMFGYFLADTFSKYLFHGYLLFLELLQGVSFVSSTTEEGDIEIKQGDACIVQASDGIPREISNCLYDQVFPSSSSSTPLPHILED